MAITKIWTVKSRLDLSLKYIANPDKTSIQPDIDAVEGVMKYIKNGDKTEQCKYVKAYNCTTDKAFSEMLETQEFFGKSGRKNGVLAYHLVQSFKDFERVLFKKVLLDFRILSRQSFFLKRISFSPIFLISASNSSRRLTT